MIEAFGDALFRWHARQRWLCRLGWHNFNPFMTGWMRQECRRGCGRTKE